MGRTGNCCLRGSERANSWEFGLGKSVSGSCAVGLGLHGFQAAQLEGLNVLLPVQNPTMQLEVIGADFFVPPALEAGFTDLPTLGKLLLIQMADLHRCSLLLNDHH